ncbi:hypothetical protein EDB84DRAFT_1516777 [Lactarius hengduanensis]|nr:hypothetical protein EDB84DRAFT_1516777 [Lactarius hengduanensis]
MSGLVARYTVRTSVLQKCRDLTTGSPAFLAPVVAQIPPPPVLTCPFSPSPSQSCAGPIADVVLSPSPSPSVPRVDHFFTLSSLSAPFSTRRMPCNHYLPGTLFPDCAREPSLMRVLMFLIFHPSPTARPSLFSLVRLLVAFRARSDSIALLCFAYLCHAYSPSLPIFSPLLLIYTCRSGTRISSIIYHPR